MVLTATNPLIPSPRFGFSAEFLGFLSYKFMRPPIIIIALWLALYFNVIPFFAERIWIEACLYLLRRFSFTRFVTCALCFLHASQPQSSLLGPSVYHSMWLLRWLSFQWFQTTLIIVIPTLHSKQYLGDKMITHLQGWILGWWSSYTLCWTLQTSHAIGSEGGSGNL